MFDEIETLLIFSPWILSLNIQSLQANIERNDIGLLPIVGDAERSFETSKTVDEVEHFAKWVIEIAIKLIFKLSKFNRGKNIGDQFFVLEWIRRWFVTLEVASQVRIVF